MASAPVAFERPGTTQEFVLAELRRRILTGAIRPGDPIRPDTVAAELQVSRVPVREALKVLEGEGAVGYRAHHGYTLASLRLADLEEIYRIRHLLESEAARAALVHLDEAGLASLRQACVEMEALGEAEADRAAMSVVNRRFHFALLEASGLPHLMRLVRLLWDASDHYRSVYYRTDEHRREVHEDHRAIVAAAQAGEPEALVRALDAHRQHAIDGLRAALEEEADE